MVTSGLNASSGINYFVLSEGVKIKPLICTFVVDGGEVWLHSPLPHHTHTYKHNVLHLTLWPLHSGHEMRTSLSSLLHSSRSWVNPRVSRKVVSTRFSSTQDPS